MSHANVATVDTIPVRGGEGLDAGALQDTIEPGTALRQWKWAGFVTSVFAGQMLVLCPQLVVTPGGRNCRLPG